MMRLLMLPVLAFAGQAVMEPALAASRAPVTRDVEGYAVATCLARQLDPALKAQGEGWASAIVQRGRGDVTLLRPVQHAVEAQVARGDMPVVRQDGPAASDLTLSIMFCGEIVDRPAVRAAITRAAVRLGPAYRRR
jgi:hypothetical protein